MNTAGSNVSLVVRLLVDAAERGEVIGHAEVVDTGEVVSLRGAADLVQLVRRLDPRLARRPESPAGNGQRVAGTERGSDGR